MCKKKKEAFQVESPFCFFASLAFSFSSAEQQRAF
jgi:hypothetical protein|tara:strand:- start:20 stop:124 length:105 start_codon:yes stop_codon:yes gene_type:complete